MIAHTGVAVRDYAKSKELYTKMLAPLGYTVSMDMPEYKGAGFMQGGNTDFWIGEKDTVVPSHTAFAADGKESIQAFYDAALAAGATDNGAPGYRPDYTPDYYAAFVHDLDGNNIEAVWFDPARKES
jgi:catechol 2,3-dioxygenase-like lactoylglutathione lyase family enzyme